MYKLANEMRVSLLLDASTTDLQPADATTEKKENVAGVDSDRSRISVLWRVRQLALGEWDNRH